MKAPPEAFAAKFTKETASKDDASFFPKKAELLAQMASVRAMSAAWVKGLTEADLAQPHPEMMRSMFPTLGHIVHLVPAHLAMHVGQIQVVRRKLGKPILF